MRGNKTMKQSLLRKPTDVLHQVIEVMILASIHSQVENHMAQLGVIIDQQHRPKPRTRNMARWTAIV